MASTPHRSLHEPEHVVLVRLVERGLAEGTITMEDVRGLTGREIRALLAERGAVQRGEAADQTPERPRP